MSAHKNLHVVQSVHGGWAVRASSSKRAIRWFQRELDAVSYGLTLAGRRGVALYRHDASGGISAKVLPGPMVGRKRL